MGNKDKIITWEEYNQFAHNLKNVGSVSVFVEMKVPEYVWDEIQKLRQDRKIQGYYNELAAFIAKVHADGYKLEIPLNAYDSFDLDETDVCFREVKDGD